MRTCVKVSNLRMLGYISLEDWLSDKDNVYVGRRGRIFIKEGTASKIFHYKESIFANPYLVTKYGLDECLRLYEIHKKYDRK